jgi:hypothetical protein
MTITTHQFTKQTQKEGKESKKIIRKMRNKIKIDRKTKNNSLKRLRRDKKRR